MAAALGAALGLAWPASLRAGHDGAPADEPAAPAQQLQSLRELEQQALKETDFRRVTSGDHVSGPDPYRLHALPGSDRLVGILRGTAEVVLLDRDLRIIDRQPAPRSPTGLTVTGGGRIFVSGELSSIVVRYEAGDGSLRRTGSIDLGPGRLIRDVAAGPAGERTLTDGSDLIYAIDERQGSLLTLRLGAVGAGGELAADRDEIPVGRGPLRVARVGPFVLVDCLLEHAVIVLPVDRSGRAAAAGGARIQHDGPIWSFDAMMAGPPEGGPAAAALLLAVGGVEDHPLDRTGGFFGYIDSFLTLYRIDDVGGALRPTRLTETNLSALGVVTPKVIALEADRFGGAGVRALVTGYASATLATLVWSRDLRRQPLARVAPLAPGTTSMVRRFDGRLIFADPLLDAWLVSALPDEAPARVVPVAEAAGAAQRHPLSGLGEALFFTTLMSPFNRADGPASRFTCETCHFEGYVDGRTHHTGRGDVRATTKPLRGLFNNRPYFSRALDPDLATMVNNEFRVAGAKSGHDPWFSLRVDDFPWLRRLGVTDPELSPLTLRRALMSFLMDFTHLPNPAVTPGARFTPEQRAGAALFRRRCESCHQARLRSDDPASRQPFERWEGLVMSEEGPLTWGMAEYRKTGVEPYVHPEGARVPSLRRLYKKRPYLTNGSGQELLEVIARARWAGDGFHHDRARAAADVAGGDSDAGDRLDAAEAGRVRAFLELL